MRQMKHRVIVHPLLLAVFPVLFIFAANVQAFGIEVTLRPTAKALFWTAVGWAALSLAFRSARKAAATTCTDGEALPPPILLFQVPVEVIFQTSNGWRQMPMPAEGSEHPAAGTP